MLNIDKDLFRRICNVLVTPRKITTYIMILILSLFYVYGSINNVSEKYKEFSKKRSVETVLVHKFEGICENSSCWKIIANVDIDVGNGVIKTYRIEDEVKPEEYSDFKVGKKFTHEYILDRYIDFEHEGYHVFFGLCCIFFVIIFSAMICSKLDD